MQLKSTLTMMSRLFLAFFCLPFIAYSRPAAVSFVPGTGKPAIRSAGVNELLNVLFATNEDCDLYINDQFKGALSKQAFLYLQLPPGHYTYHAKSKSSGDELKDTFSVWQGRTNEFFIDLLYTIDEKAEQRRIAKNKPSSSVNQAVSTRMVTENKPAPAAGKIEKEKATVEALLASMVLVSKGGFVMGNNKAPAADEVEHPVSLSAFYMGKYEVTQEQWESIMGYNPSFHGNCSTCPVENISWEEAVTFTRKLSVLSDKTFRLPTEAEWEYVARIGGRAEIENAGGQEIYIKNTAWYAANSNGKTSPVGKRAPNVLGIYDLTGNVSEWCTDWYSVSFYKEDYSQKDPEGPPLGKEKVIRGGNFRDFVGDRFRPSFRNKRKPTEKGGEIGLRLVMEVN